MAKAKNTDKLVVQNAAKTLLANIRFASVDDPIRTITVTSSIPNEGKSTVSINLAQAIATSGKSAPKTGNLQILPQVGPQGGRLDLTYSF